MDKDNTTFNSLILASENDSRSVEVAEIQATIPFLFNKYLKNPELEQYDGVELAILTAKSKPKPHEHIAKKAFWREYNAAVKAGRRVNTAAFLHDVCSLAVFKKLLLSPIKLAWFMAPSISYSTKVETLLDRSTERYEELINMSIMTTKKIKVDDEDVLIKEVDAKKAMVLLSVIKNLEERVKGSAVQRNVSVKTTEPSGTDTEARVDMNAVNTRLKELEEKLGEMPVDVVGVIDES